MALSYLKSRGVHGIGLQTRRPARCVVRAQAGSSGTAVSFKIHRHVEYGQSLLVVGNVPELGSWDAKQAVELQWGEGDNWTTSASLTPGTALEYKYIVRRKDALDWCPGQNKSITLPSAASIEVTDSWDNPHSNVAVLTPLDVAPVAVEAAAATPTVAEAEAALIAEAPPSPPVVIIAEAPLPSSEGNGVPSEDLLAVAASGNGYAAEAVTAVSTVENLHVAELENVVPDPAALTAAPQRLHQHPQPPTPTTTTTTTGGSFLANNIVQGVPMGAVAVGQDPISLYEEADKYQVVEVGSAGKATQSGEARASSSSAATAAAKSLDKMTMAELRSEVKRRGMSPLGNRRELLTRLQNAGVV